MMVLSIIGILAIVYLVILFAAKVVAKILN